MNKDQIESMKKSGKLKLSIWDLISHYLICFFLTIPLLVSLHNLIFYLTTNEYYYVRTPEEVLPGSLSFFAIGVLFYFWQRKKLDFFIFTTNLTNDSIQNIIDVTAKELEWENVKNLKNFKVFKTHPNWSSGSWGEQITIIIDKNRLMINSICDPEKKASIVSFGRNKKNKRRFVELIRQASS